MQKSTQNFKQDGCSPLASEGVVGRGYQDRRPSIGTRRPPRASLDPAMLGVISQKLTRLAQPVIAASGRASGRAPCTPCPSVRARPQQCTDNWVWEREGMKGGDEIRTPPYSCPPQHRTAHNKSAQRLSSVVTFYRPNQRPEAFHRARSTGYCIIECYTLHLYGVLNLRRRDSAPRHGVPATTSGCRSSGGGGCRGRIRHQTQSQRLEHLLLVVVHSADLAVPTLVGLFFEQEVTERKRSQLTCLACNRRLQDGRRVFRQRKVSQGTLG